ncbi:MAG: NAD(+) synthase, partial [Oscillospiraceae bacterium]
DKELQKTLLDVLATPVSPELLPTNSQGEQAQKTEDLVGSYLLHDFFIYNALRNEFSPKKVYRLACIAFKGQFDNEEILKWLKVFYKRFFAQQFKRNCCPDGVAVFDFSLSPRSGFVMPSDGVGKLWQEQLDEIK